MYLSIKNSQNNTFEYFLLEVDQGSVLTREAENRFKVLTLGDAGAVFGAGVPQVFKLPLGGDDAAHHGGDLPVVINQCDPSKQPAYDGHDEPSGFQSRRHDGFQMKKSNKSSETAN